MDFHNRNGFIIKTKDDIIKIRNEKKQNISLSCGKTFNPIAFLFK